MGTVYQNGSIRRLKRARGNEVWEWRYRLSGKMKQQTFPVAEFPNEKAIRKHLQASINLLNEGTERPLPVAVTMGVAIGRYKIGYISELASRSARDTYTGAIDMRHASITTTMDTYGGTRVEEMRPHVDAVAAKLTPAVVQTPTE